MGVCSVAYGFECKCRSFIFLLGLCSLKAHPNRLNLPPPPTPKTRLHKTRLHPPPSNPKPSYPHPPTQMPSGIGQDDGPTLS